MNRQILPAIFCVVATVCNATTCHVSTTSNDETEFFKDYANGDYTPKVDGLITDAGAVYEGMSALDLAGLPRKKGRGVDIGCFECQKTKGFLLFVR